MTKLQQLLEKVDDENVNGNAEGYHKAVMEVGNWVYRLYVYDRINPSEIKMGDSEK